MTTSTGLPAHVSAALAAAGPTLVTLDRVTAAAPVVSLPFEPVAALDLGGGRWLAVVRDAAGRRWSVPVVEDGLSVRRARPGDGAGEALVALLADASTTTEEVAVRTWRAGPVRGEQQIGVDQTNDSVVVGDPGAAGAAAVVKWLVHQPDVGSAHGHPAARRLAALADAGFAGTPAPWGLVTVDVGEGAPLLLVTVVEHVPGAVDGWTWAVDGVRELARGAHPLEDALAPPTELGALTARLHVALARSGTDRATDSDARRWIARAGADLDLAVASVGGAEGVRLRALVPAAERELDRLAAISGTPLIDVHGDLHVGQVLRHGRPPAYLVVDFDGNPVVPEAERAARQPAAVDVAGMLASLDHVGRVVVRRTEDVDAEVVGEWIRQARQRFLAAYRAVLAEAGRPELLDERLVRPLLVMQEIREYLYAVRHLPHWTYVPDQALPALLEER